MDRQRLINKLLARGPDDTRRLALDTMDQRARDTNSFGSREHREGRDKVEREHDRERQRLEGLSDAELTTALGTE